LKIERIQGIVLLFMVIFSLSIMPGSLFAADPPPDAAVRMEEVLVVSTPVIEGNQVTPYAGSMTTISQEQISDLNAQDLPSALRRTPGVIISRHNPVGSFGGGDGGAIFIRGMGSSRPGAEIQTLVDGIPRFVGVWTHPLMDTMSVDAAERIEVYKGAQPVLFGNMALGAVNVVTKRQQAEGFTTKIQAGAGSYGTYVESLEHGGKIGATDYYLTQSWRRSSGHRDEAGGELQNYFVRLGRQLSNPWYLSTTVNHTDNWADDPGPEGNPAARQGTYKVNDTMAVMTLANAFERARGYLKAYWLRGDIDWVNQPGATDYFDTLTDYDNYGLRIQEAVNPWRGGEILLGADMDYFGGEVLEAHPNPAKNKSFARDTFRIISPYGALSHRFSPTERFSVTPSAGVRYFDHSEFDHEWAPQAGIIVQYMDTQWHASYAKGINYPGVNVAAFTTIVWDANERWRNLEPEKVDHYEVGLGQRFGRTFRADATFFYDDGSNRYVIVAPKHFENIASFMTKGVEVNVTFTPLPVLSLYGGMTRMLKQEPFNLPYAPDWSASAGMNYRFFKSFLLSLDTVYTDRQYVANNRAQNYGAALVQIDPYWILNGKLSYEFSLDKPKFDGELYIAGENLTDVSYAYKKDYPMPGINGMVGIVLKF
jgi:outer membrane receptor protein involved in Fe transport